MVNRVVSSFQHLRASSLVPAFVLNLLLSIFFFLLVLLVFYYWCIICLFSLLLFVFSVKLLLLCVSATSTVFGNKSLV